MTGYWPTIQEAAATVGVSRDTIKRGITNGRFPNARRRNDVNATWEIPIGDLSAAGYILRPVETAVGEGPGITTEAATLRELRERVQALEVQLARASALADERSARITDLQVALAAVTELRTSR